MKSFISPRNILISILLLGLGICTTGYSLFERIRNQKSGPGDYEFTIVHEGKLRKYSVHAPAGYDGVRTFPLVLNLHGGGGSAQGHRKMSGLDGAADRHGFVAAYPAGTRADGNARKRYLRFWNQGNGPGGEANSDPLLSHVDDVGFVSAVLDDVSRKFLIDKNRIYATGFSNGAMLVHRLGCELNNRIAAIAPVAGQFWQFPDSCKPVRPVPMIYFHGTADVCAPFSGGPSQCESGIANSGRIFPPVEQTIKVWKEKNGCTDEAKITYQNGQATCSTFNQCHQGSEVTLCTIQGGGHTWPGGKSYKLPGIEVGTVTHDIDANEAMWEFFMRHPLHE